jgi:hypothetical protein
MDMTIQMARKVSAVMFAGFFVFLRYCSFRRFGRHHWFAVEVALRPHQHRQKGHPQ